jgi:hypothetical protein
MVDAICTGNGVAVGTKGVRLHNLTITGCAFLVSKSKGRSRRDIIQALERSV